MINANMVVAWKTSLSFAVHCADPSLRFAATKEDENSPTSFGLCDKDSRTKRISFERRLMFHLANPEAWPLQRVMSLHWWRGSPPFEPLFTTL